MNLATQAVGVLIAALVFLVRVTAAIQRARVERQVAEHRSGYVVNALDWLLTSNDAPSGPRRRP
ncbi:MAG: hypothetical protein ACRDSE_09100 [Pseudonocardiaceae bacterium]